MIAVEVSQPIWNSLEKFWTDIYRCVSLGKDAEGEFAELNGKYILKMEQSNKPDPACLDGWDLHLKQNLNFVLLQVYLSSCGWLFRGRILFPDWPWRKSLFNMFGFLLDISHGFFINTQW